ncbi:MAG: hypothetical protein AB7O43_00755 [Hyphomicrobiaceae bacterium]
MACIIEFVARKGATQDIARRVSDRPHTCQIIIFPGVRYEHWDNRKAGSKPSAKRRRRKATRRSAS